MTSLGNMVTVDIMKNEIRNLEKQRDMEKDWLKKEKIQKEIEQKNKIVLMFSAYQP